MKKYDKIKRLGHDQNKRILENPDDQIIIKEKLDGANFRWTFNEDGEPVFGSKNVEYREDGEPVYDSEEYDKLDGRFTDAIEHVRNKTEDLDGENYTRYTFFGENMVSHSLEYRWGEVPQVIGFDVYDHKKEEWLSVAEAHTTFEMLGIETAPILMSTTAEEVKRKHKENEDGFPIPESRYRDGKGEGVVIINIDQEEPDLNGFNYRAKLVTDEFAEKHKEATGANQSREAVSDTEKLVSKFCTDGRIRKHIEKLQDRGRSLGMELMENEDDVDGLPMAVTKDIIEEEYDTFATSSKTVDFKEFRSKIAKRCVHVLKQEVQKLG